MDNGKLRIDNIFNGKTFFSIPDYQRSYAWEEKQLRDFFEDYMNNYNSQEYLLWHNSSSNDEKR